MLIGGRSNNSSILNEIGRKANTAAHYICIWLNQPFQVSESVNLQAIQDGKEVCDFLSQNLSAISSDKIEFQQLGAFTILSPIKEDLEEIDENGIEHLQKEASEVKKLLAQFEDEITNKKKVLGPDDLLKGYRFFCKIREPFLDAASRATYKELTLIGTK